MGLLKFLDNIFSKEFADKILGEEKPLDNLMMIEQEFEEIVHRENKYGRLVPVKIKYKKMVRNPNYQDPVPDKLLVSIPNKVLENSEKKQLYCTPFKEDLNSYLDPDNVKSPLNNFIGNRNALELIRPLLYTALCRENCCAGDMAIFLRGAASTGKTTLAELIAKILKLPLLVIHPKSVKTIDNIAEQIYNLLINTNSVLQEKNGIYVIPPIVVFLDEVHALSSEIFNGLLKAIERTDAKLITKKGIVYNTTNILWIVATTENIDFKPFGTRFLDIQLLPYTREEIATIVQRSNPSWDMDTCRLIAKYNLPIPRKAKMFADLLKMAIPMNKDIPLQELVIKYAQHKGMDQFGLHQKQLAVLKILGKNMVSKDNLENMVSFDNDQELNEEIMPSLMSYNEGMPLVKVTRKGYALTTAGANELKKRGIVYNEEMVLDD